MHVWQWFFTGLAAGLCVHLAVSRRFFGLGGDLALGALGAVLAGAALRFGGLSPAGPALVHVTAALVGALASSPGAAGLSGAELVVGAGWFGLRSHPRPAASIVVGGPGLPDWFDTILEEQCR